MGQVPVQVLTEGAIHPQSNRSGPWVGLDRPSESNGRQAVHGQAWEKMTRRF